MYTPRDFRRGGEAAAENQEAAVRVHEPVVIGVELPRCHPG